VHTGDTITVEVSRSASRLPRWTPAIPAPCHQLPHIGAQAGRRRRHACRCRGTDASSGSVAKTPCLNPPPCLRSKRRTRQTGRDQSRRGWTPPGRRGCAARGWTKPRSARPSLRRMCGPGWPRRRVRHFAVGGKAVSLAENRAARQQRRQRGQVPSKAPGGQANAMRGRNGAQLSFAGACRAD